MFDGDARVVHQVVGGHARQVAARQGASGTNTSMHHDVVLVVERVRVDQGHANLLASVVLSTKVQAVVVEAQGQALDELSGYPIAGGIADEHQAAALQPRLVNLVVGHHGQLGPSPVIERSVMLGDHAVGLALGRIGVSPNDE